MPAQAGVLHSVNGNHVTDMVRVKRREVFISLSRHLISDSIKLEVFLPQKAHVLSTLLNAIKIGSVMQKIIQ